jgi:putative NADH-flavin reductase
MKVLFIGGTGIISTACSELAVRRGIELYHLNRGQSKRPTPEGTRKLHGDIRQPGSAAVALGDLSFDCVVEWMAFTRSTCKDVELPQWRTGQDIFTSHFSHHKPPRSLPAL